MQPTIKSQILRANSLYLGFASISALLFLDIPGSFLASGPLSRLGAPPEIGIGFIEAHGLALILSVLLWRAAPARSWHLTAMAIHTLLGTANLVFWRLFEATGTLAMGYITTSLHWFFVVAQLIAAMAALEENQTEFA